MQRNNKINTCSALLIGIHCCVSGGEILAQSIDKLPKANRCALSIDGKTRMDALCAIDYEDSENFEWSDQAARIHCADGTSDCPTYKIKYVTPGNFGFIHDDGDGRATLFWNGGSGLKAENGFLNLEKTGNCWESDKAELKYGNDKPLKVQFCIYPIRNS